ncbi:mechanosensitive ion channel domain-containing protein [Crocosphaera sp. UHCC 0190]|uniref:mechanosensitive ion channel family protein n=1 Tax=Crocosphaera sp. UHCC 0190 TaxID=3110246 RepID=UPI002B1FDE3B|nr:mechanosensitive ion channel domain-containing protein [Crocosphaera sp. UHCC 0190]MEA5508485.1 mechanosensitive ion channel domain-containing protein [Crocosphaera sp. UHCC 0190]
MKKYWQALIIFVLVTCLIVLSNSLAYSQKSPNSENKSNDGSVVFNNETLFVIQEKFGPASQQQRAKEISNRIEGVAKDFSIPLDSFQVAEVEGVEIVSSKDTVLIGITESDAKAAGKTQKQLAAEYLQKIKTSIAQYRKEHSLLRLIQNWFSHPIVIKLIIIAIGIVLINVIFRYLSRSLPRYITDSDISYYLRKVITFIGYLAIVLFVTIVFSDRLGQLTVVFGVIGAGVAFALQEVIASIAGWLAISLGQFYNPGDRIQLGGIMGDVIDISILRTTVMEIGAWVKADLYNGRIVRIANSFVFKEPVYNYSADFPFVWDEIVIPVKYGSDHHLAREILQRVAEEVVGEYVPHANTHWKEMVHKYLIENARVEPAVTLVTTDNWMEFTLRYVVDYKSRRVKRDQLFTRILDEFLMTGDRVAYASTTFHLVETPVFDVRINRDRNGQEDREND